MQFGTVAEVISSQVHHMNCCEESEIFSTANMLHKIQFLRPLKKNHDISGPIDGYHTMTGVKETDIDSTSPFTMEINENHLISCDMKIDWNQIVPTTAIKDTDSDNISLGECTSATAERDSDNEALGESTAATKSSAVKEANIHCREYVTNETDVDCSSTTTDRERNCNSTISSDKESDMYPEAPSKDTSDDYEKETKDGHRVPNSKETELTTKKEEGDHTSSTISRKKSYSDDMVKCFVLSLLFE